MRRALALDEGFDAGAIHEYFVAFEGGRPAAMGGSAQKARAHFERAVELSGGKKVSSLVTYAETVSVRAQDRKEFLALLDRALSFDARGSAPEYRMANLVAQRRARWSLPEPKVKSGYLARYAAHVTSASEGAILR